MRVWLFCSPQKTPEKSEFRSGAVLLLLSYLEGIPKCFQSREQIKDSSIPGLELEKVLTTKHMLQKFQTGSEKMLLCLFLDWIPYNTPLYGF